MTDPLPPLTDEDLSAVVDGVAGPELVARVQADPRARARVDALRAAGDALRAAPVVPLDPGTVDALVARAIDRGTTPAGDVVAPLPLARPGRRQRGPSPLLVAAAVVALVAVGIGLIWSGQRADEELATPTAAPTPEAADRAGEGAANEGEADEAPGDAVDDPRPGASPHGEEPPPTSGAGGNEGAVLPSLGRFDTADDLRDALRDAFPEDLPRTTGSAADSPTVGAVARCRGQVQEVFGIDEAPTHEGVAEVDGRRVLVYEFDAPAVVEGDATALVTAVGPDACDSVLNFQR